MQREAVVGVVVRVSIGSYPRDEVFCSWVDDGRVREGTATIHARAADGSWSEVGEVVLGRLDVVQHEVDVGAEIVVELRARLDGQVYGRRVTFVASHDEDSVCISAIGPGARAEPRPRRLFARTRYSGFEFGVLAMGATTEQGTLVTGRSGPLVEHAPGDGVGPT